MLCVLMDGRACTATELATAAEIAPSTASVHLKKLAQEGLVEVVAQGKHRYFRLSGPEVGAAIEALLVVAGVAPGKVRPSAPAGLRHARICYDHAAGEVGVALHDWMLAQGWLRAAGREYLLDAAAVAPLRRLGVDVGAAQAARRRFAYPCLDWSERRPHLGGALAAVLLEALLRKGIFARAPGHRALEVTRAGKRFLGKL